MDYKLWSTCNDLDTVATNQETTQDTFAFVLDGLDRAAAEASRGGQEAAAVFMNQYTNYSKMLFVLLDVMQGQNKEAQRLIERAFELVKEVQA